MVGGKGKEGDSLTGLVFNIVTGSFVDGFGIRTTVFLKGCPLRCLWCCNPEGQEGYRELKVTAAQCDGCGRCLTVCPRGAIRLDTGGGSLAVDRALCNDCGECLEVCYTGALEFFGERMTVDEVFNTVRKGEQFYRASGGGVTIGGGEPAFQPLFTLALLRKCRENYIHTAVDTCGYVNTEDGFKILEEADLLLFDLKGIDPELHRRNTGVSNELILNNIKRLDAMRKPMIIRLPLIPGCTDSPENIQATAELLSGLKSVVRVDLLAYHQYGMVKYGQLGREYGLQLEPLTEERLEGIKAFMEGCGLKVQFGG